MNVQLLGASVALAALLSQPLAAHGQEPARDEAPVLAAEPSSEEDDIVVTGRRAPRSISSIPNSISVIGQEELTAQFSVDENLPSLLAFNVPGFAGRSSTIQSVAVLRGRTALVLIDGVPQNQLLRSSGFDIQTIAPEAIARVEVLRGANAVFGFGATGGVINFITKRAPEVDGFEVIAKVRTAFQTSRLEPTREFYGQASGRKGRFGLVIGAGFDNLEPVFDGDGGLLPNDNTDAGRDIVNVHGALDIDITSKQRLRATMNYFDRDDVLEDFAITAAEGDPNAGTFATARFAEAFFTDFDNIYYGTEEVDPATLPFDLPGGEQTFTNATLSYQNDDVFGSSLEVVGLFHDFDLSFPFSRFAGLDLQQERERTRLGVRTSVDTPLDFIRDGARLIWGADFISETVDEGNNQGTATGVVQGTRTTIRLSPFIRQRATGFWGGVEIPVGPLLFSGGVRHDIIDATLDNAEFDFGGFFEGGEVDYSATVFNAGVIYYVRPELDLYFSFTQGFDVTDIGRAAFQVDSAALINPEPAITDSFEIGARTRLKNFSAAVAAFYADSELAARTVRVPGISIALPLRQPEKVWGVEASWTYELGEKFDFGGNFTWNDGERRLASGNIVPIQNRFLAPLTVTAYGNWRPTTWFDGRVQLSQNFRSDDFNASTAFGEGDFENLTLVDLLARFKSEKYGTIDVGVDNLFNVVDVAPGDRANNLGGGFFPILGRTISLTYRYQFASRKSP